MDKDKPFYVTSYIKDYVKEQAGATPDQSVFDEIQNAILGVLRRGFDIAGKKAVLKPLSDTTAKPAEEKPDMVKLSGIPRSGIYGSGKDPKYAALVRCADGVVMHVDAESLDVTIIDVERIDRMCGHMVYDTYIKRTVDILRKIGPRIKSFDCAKYADLIEETHRRRRLNSNE